MRINLWGLGMPHRSICEVIECPTGRCLGSENALQVKVRRLGMTYRSDFVVSECPACQSLGSRNVPTGQCFGFQNGLSVKVWGHGMPHTSLGMPCWLIVDAAAETLQGGGVCVVEGKNFIVFARQLLPIPAAVPPPAGRHHPGGGGQKGPFFLGWCGKNTNFSVFILSM